MLASNPGMHDSHNTLNSHGWKTHTVGDDYIGYNHPKGVDETGFNQHDISVEKNGSWLNLHGNNDQDAVGKHGNNAKDLEKHLGTIKF